METITIELTDLVGYGAALLGFGFSAWAFTLRRAMGVLDKLGVVLEDISRRMAIVEEWRRHVDIELERVHRHVQAE